VSISLSNRSKLSVLSYYRGNEANVPSSEAVSEKVKVSVVGAARKTSLGASVEEKELDELS